VKALARFRLKRDFGGKFPDEGYYPYIPELPLARDLETGDFLVIGPP
jgi:hypothetical protein